MSEVMYAVLVTIGVILVLEIVFMGAQLLVYRHRRRHLPTFPVRTWWERTVGDQLDRWFDIPIGVERRAQAAPKAQERFEKRSQHFRERLWAKYPTLRPEPTPEPVETLSAPRFGAPSLITYRLGEYVEPLRCSVGLYCGGRELVDGEQYWAVPPDAEPDSPFLVICGHCTVIPEEARA